MGDPTLQQLRYLVALHDHGHFGRAAAACFVSQPALSTQLRELEQRLGATLVERRRGALLFTPAGRDIVARARRILGDVNDLRDAARVGTTITGPFRLGTIPTIGPYLLPRTLPIVANHVPDATVTLREAQTAVLIEELRSGELDLLLLGTEEPDTDLDTAHLGTDTFLLAVPERHPLATRRGPIAHEQIADLRVLVLSEGHCLRDQTLSVCALVGADSEQVQASGLATVVQMVAAGMGVTFLPASAAAVEARPGNGIAVRRIRTPAPARPITLTWRASSPYRAHYEELVNLLRRALQLRSVH
jgi:LysR family hydrogen peroxide-inducible transcriptional activator